MFKSIRRNLRNYQNYLKNKAYYDQLEEYLKNKCLLPSLHIVKQNNINDLRDKFKTQIFVESGTFMGDMIEAQKDHFKTLYSIELSDHLYEKAVDRFKNNHHVNIMHGDSGIVIKEILKYLNEPALFWLDGHYSAGITAKSDKNTPILTELESILTHMQAHVILVDDTRLFTGEDDYPTIPELCQFVLSINPNQKITVADDIIRIMPNQY